MIRDIIGTVSLVDVEDGSPVAVAVMDQKGSHPRCELKVAQELLAALPSLDGQTITADPCTAKKKPRASSPKKAANTSCKSKATTHASAIRPHPVPRRPPFVQTACGTDASNNGR